MSIPSTRAHHDQGDADRPLRRDARENRQRLLEAAAEVFAAQGLDAPVEEVVHSAGVGMGTLYRQFPNKEALIDQLVSDLFEQVLGAGRQALDAPGGAGLESFLRETARLQEARRGWVARLWQSPVPDAFVAELDQILARLLAQAQAAGLVRDDCVVTDLNVTLWALRGVVESTGGAAPGAWERHLDLVLAGLRPRAAALPHPPLTTEARVAVTRSRRAARD